MTEAPRYPVALALGSNVGDRRQSLHAALVGLEPYIHVTVISNVYETMAAYVTDQPNFLNAALCGTTHLQPLTLLWTLKNLEHAIGRQPTFRYGPRVIDIDLIFYADRIMAIDELTLPHPRLDERDFVLRPLIDVAPDWHHPRTGLTAADMLSQLPVSKMANLGKLS